MSDYLPNSINNYIYSDYRVDDQYQGFLSFDAHANLGRAISFIDITSQVEKAVFGTATSMVISVGRVTAGTGSLLIAIPSSLMWGITNLMGCKCKDFFKEKTVFLFPWGLENVMRGFRTICIAIPFSLVWRIFIIVADTLGIFLPEVGRWARNLDKMLNAALADMNENTTEQEAYVGDNAESTERSKSQERSGPRYRHNFKPQAELLGGLNLH